MFYAQKYPNKLLKLIKSENKFFDFFAFVHVVKKILTSPKSRKLNRFLRFNDLSLLNQLFWAQWHQNGINFTCKIKKCPCVHQLFTKKMP